MKKDILTVEDVKLLVDSFYSKVKEDPILGTIFNSVIQDRWPQHLEKMVRFWQTILLDQPSYSGSAFKAHANLPVQKEHFDRWIQLFYETIDQRFTGEKALEAKTRSKSLADVFLYKIEYLRNNPGQTIA